MSGVGNVSTPVWGRWDAGTYREFILVKHMLQDEIMLGPGEFSLRRRSIVVPVRKFAKVGESARSKQAPSRVGNIPVECLDAVHDLPLFTGGMLGPVRRLALVLPV